MNKHAVKGENMQKYISLYGYIVKDNEGDLCYDCDVKKLEADCKKQIATLEAQVKEKDDQIEAALFSGTQGEIIRTQKEQIATLTAELTEVKQRRESAWERIDELGNQVIDLSFKLKEMEAKNG